MKQLLEELKIPLHKPSVPAQSKTPSPEKQKVVSIPTRTPINRQAGLMISPMRCWLSKPLPPEKLPNPHQKEIDSLQAELKIERNNHAETRDDLGSVRAKVRELNALLARQHRLIESLKDQLKSKDEIIRQLEDLKL